MVAFGLGLRGALGSERNARLQPLSPRSVLRVSVRVDVPVWVSSHGIDCSLDDAGRVAPRLGRAAQHLASVGGHPPVGVPGDVRDARPRSSSMRRMHRDTALAGGSSHPLAEPGQARYNEPTSYHRLLRAEATQGGVSAQLGLRCKNRSPEPSRGHGRQKHMFFERSPKPHASGFETCFDTCAHGFV